MITQEPLHSNSLPNKTLKCHFFATWYSDNTVHNMDAKVAI